MENSKRMAAYEKQYMRMKARFLDLQFGDDTLTIGVLQSVKDFYNEGKEMHHCVYASEYYKKEDALIMSARIGNKRIETIEVNLKTLEIVQSRGACNKNTEYHNRIIELVKKNIGLIRKRLSA